MLTPPEISRYSRNILLDEVKRGGQEKLKSSRVTVIGAGGLGSPVLFYLAAAGIGKIRILDSDIVDTTNLQRQILFKHSEIGSSKAETAKQRIQELNPFIEVESFPLRIQEENAENLLKDCDLILEGSDNFETKFLINDLSCKLKIPLLIAGILRFDGMILGIRPGIDPCYRCIYETLPPSDAIPSCSEAGVIGSMAGIIGSIQATEAVKFLLGLVNEESPGVFGSILQLEAKSMNFHKVSLLKRSDCKACSHI
ncbi:HesA/MoeB/ThiF family protein [Leptospira stimsonii]|uniref:Adenylyltransferase n=1 Tax=Leptospira stimsonii TaxID=2202203 RepID=A0A4R9L3N9_9LEPT|nr:HesA/MoeB/ThiF family protein [Leptospira stimsonii]RHX91715.1 adenylyltransferase [Leptospira stimsonii]TGK15518.1 HesA/MoeB/ThiF family protein [Leptospira stimsonii]TGM16471.1 HesA/MoeB/ThiF family protein [Leptospira stimsonii]